MKRLILCLAMLLLVASNADATPRVIVAAPAPIVVHQPFIVRPAFVAPIHAPFVVRPSLAISTRHLVTVPIRDLFGNIIGFRRVLVP